MKLQHLILLICLPGFLAYSNDDFHCSHHPTSVDEKGVNKSEIDVINYDLKFDFSELKNELDGTAILTFKATKEISSIQLDLLGLRIDSIIYNGVNTKKYRYESNSLLIDLHKTLSANSVDSVRIHYGGKPTIDKSDFGGFYFREGFIFNMGVAFTDQPHVYGRSWFPCKDNFHDRATYDYTIITKKGDRAFCNGLRVSEEVLEGEKTIARWRLKTEIPTYLAVVCAGPYKGFEMSYTSDLQGIDIPIHFVARPKEMGKLKMSFQNLSKSVKAFEDNFGPYNWEKIGYALIPFESGAMEHATLISYPMGEADGTLKSENLMAHELSHHWWGNWVTCASPKEMWINEGMASFSEYLFFEAVYGKERYLEEMRKDHYAVMQRGHYYDAGHYAMNEIPGEYTYGIHSYKKGAALMHTLRSYMGDEAFFAGLKYIQKTFGGRNISTEEFMVCMMQKNKIAQDFFNNWMLQPGSVNFQIDEVTSLKTTESYDVFLKIRQTKRGAKNYFENVPMTATLIAPDGRRYEEVVESNGSLSSVKIEAPFAPHYVGLNLDEKICGATTARSMVVEKAGEFDWSYANVGVKVTKSNKESFLVIENHWVGPEGEIPSGYGISKERYWNVDGLGIENIEGHLDFHFNGETSRNGFIDFELFTFSNASVKNLTLLYRSSNDKAWVVHKDHMVQTAKSNATSGKITVSGIKKGQYALGYKFD